MRGMLTTAAACLAAAGSLIAAGAAQAQAPSQVQNMGAARNEPKKPQYIPGNKPQEKIFPLGETWTAVSLNGKPFSGGDRPSFIVDSQYRARGYSGCNTFAATAFPLREQHIAVGPLAISKKACDKGVAAIEQAFLVALRTAGQWDVVGSQLILKSQAGELRFDRAL